VLESETVIGVPEVVHPPLAGAVIPFSGPDTRGEIGNPAAFWLSPEGSTTAVSDGAYLYDHAPMWTRRRRASAGGLRPQQNATAHGDFGAGAGTFPPPRRDVLAEARWACCIWVTLLAHVKVSQSFNCHQLER
jgi:hypothetical protein